MNYAIANKNTVLIEETANTTNSRYGAVAFTAFRKFKTRDAARKYKRSLKTPRNYAIVQIATNDIIR